MSSSGNDDEEYIPDPLPPYDFYTLEGVMLKLDSERGPVEKDKVITAWMKGGANNKDSRNQAIAYFIKYGQIIELEGKFMLTGEEDDDFQNALAKMPPLWAGKIYQAKKAQESGVFRLKETGTLIWNLNSDLEGGAGGRDKLGAKSPTADSECEVEYSGKLVNGKEFAARKISKFAPKSLLKGMDQVLQLMCEGDRFGAAVDYTCGYLERGSPPEVPGFSTLCFEFRLIKVLTEGKPAADRDQLFKISTVNGADIDGFYEQ